MKNILRTAAVIFSSLLVFTSCDKNDDDIIVAKGAFEGGYFILNESGGNNSAIVTYVDAEGVVTPDPYFLVNPTHNAIGTYLQDMFFDDTRGFIISGSANAITVVDRYTLEYITTIDTDMNAPRYGTVEGGKAYVTNTGDWSSATDDFVTVIDLDTYATSTIAINNNAERITSTGGKVYVANGYYGSGNSVTVINTSNNQLSVIDLGAGNCPNSMDVENGALYVMTYNYGSNGKFFGINLSSQSITTEKDLPASLVDTHNLQVENNQAYFTVDNGVYTFGVSGSVAISNTPLFSYESTSAWGAMYGFAVKDNTIYIAEGGDFASNSTAYEYSLTGELLKTVSTGVGPNSFHFN